LNEVIQAAYEARLFPDYHKSNCSVIKNTEVSERKKKSGSNYQQLVYKHKEFEPYNRTDKKRNSNYLKDLIRQP
jgi:hypothetical protein